MPEFKASFGIRGAVESSGRALLSAIRSAFGGVFSRSRRSEQDVPAGGAMRRRGGSDTFQFTAQDASNGNQRLHELDFVQACKWGDVNRMLTHLERGMSPDVRGDDGLTGLMEAASSESEGRFEVVRLLIDRKANLNTANELGYTALMLATTRHVRVDNLALCTMLIDGGADVHAQTRPNKVDLIQFAPDHSFGLTELLIQRGANFRSRSDIGGSLLMKFAKSAADDAGHACFTLLELGLDPLEKNRQGLTTIDLAKQNRSGVALAGIQAWHARRAARAAIASMDLEVGPLESTAARPLSTAMGVRHG